MNSILVTFAECQQHTALPARMEVCVCVCVPVFLCVNAVCFLLLVCAGLFPLWSHEVCEGLGQRWLATADKMLMLVSERN